MQTLPNDIVLRPRFQLEVSGSKEKLPKNFEAAKIEPFLVKRLDEHIFIKFKPLENHFWSPQLHVEVDMVDTENSRIHGVFGPNPSLWTFFMFLHFGVATVFITLGVWAYSSAALNKGYGLQLILMCFMVILWCVLYFFGRAGKHRGEYQMQELHTFMTDICALEQIRT